MKSSKLSLHLTKSANGLSWNTWKSPGIGCSDLPFSQPLSTRHWFVHFEGRPALPGESVKRCHLHPARYAPSNSMPHSHPAAVFSKAVPNAALKRIRWQSGGTCPKDRRRSVAVKSLDTAVSGLWLYSDHWWRPGIMNLGMAPCCRILRVLPRYHLNMFLV